MRLMQCRLQDLPCTQQPCGASPGCPTACWIQCPLWDTSYTVPAPASLGQVICSAVPYSEQILDLALRKGGGQNLWVPHMPDPEPALASPGLCGIWCPFEPVCNLCYMQHLHGVGKGEVHGPNPACRLIPCHTSDPRVVFWGMGSDCMVIWGGPLVHDCLWTQGPLLLCSHLRGNLWITNIWNLKQKHPQSCTGFCHEKRFVTISTTPPVHHG